MNRPDGSNRVCSLGAGGAALGVGLGALGAHALAGLPAKQLAFWQTATQYLFVASFGTMLAGLVARPQPGARGPASLLLAGALLFSGTLYAMALGAPRWLGMITPVGGLSLLAGFAWLGFAAWRAR
jgi:uncharacterized membrane protein YgdD (TMEM256/DUF423 family)